MKPVPLLLALCACGSVYAPVVTDAGSSTDTRADAESTASGTKGIFVWGQTIRGHEPTFAAWAAAHGYTDVFVLIKGTSGTVAYDVLAAMLRARDAASSSVRIWAWMVGFADHGHSDPAWQYAVGNWIAPDDLGYRAHLVAVTRDALDPARGHVPEPPDGVMLDDSFQWPSASFGTNTTHRVETVMDTVDAIRAEVIATATAHGRTIRLGFAPHPEVAVVEQSASEIITVDAESYGQDLGELGKRCDWILPETYRYDFYPEAAGWIGGVVGDIRRELALEAPAQAPTVEVDPVLALYHGDNDPSPISAADLAADRSAARVAPGYSVFRFMSRPTDAEELPTELQEEVLDQP